MEWSFRIWVLITIVASENDLCDGNVILANISRSNGDWRTAMQFCNTPLGSRTPLNLSSDTVSVSAADRGRLAWIGAYGLYSSWLKMLGCFRVTDGTISSKVNRTTTLKQTNVYNCFEFCTGFQYFALSNTQCYCFTSIFPIESNGRCYPQRCSGNQGDFCGETLTSNSLMSLMMYEIDTVEFVGAEECLASQYTGIFNEGGTSYYGFRAPVVLPCNTNGLGYTYRTRLDFPASHNFRLYTLPVTSWEEAVYNSYGNQFGLLEFVIFRFRLPDLSQPMTGDQYWVGFLRRHKMEFGTGIPTGTQAHCVAGEVDGSGKLIITYRFCNESLPVLCEFQQPEETTPDTSSISNIITIGNIIDNTVTTSVNLDWFIIIAVFAIALIALIIVGVCWIVLTLRKKRRSMLNTSTDNVDSDGLYTEIESVYSVITDGDTISTVSDIQLPIESISLPERKKRRSLKRKSKKKSLPVVPDETLSQTSEPGASRLADLPVRRQSDYNIIKSVIKMYGEDPPPTPPTPPPTPRHSIPDIIPEGEYYILEEIINKETSNTVEDNKEEHDDGHFYHVLEPKPTVEENTNRNVDATLRAVANRIPLSKWVGGRAASYEPSRIARVHSSREGNLGAVEEEYEVDLNKKKKSMSVRGKPHGVKETSLHPHAALKSTTSAPPLKLSHRGSSRKYKTTKQAMPEYDSTGYVIPLSMKKTDLDKSESMYDHTKRYRKGSTRSDSNDIYDTLDSIRDYVIESSDKSEQNNSKTDDSTNKKSVGKKP